MSNYEELLDIIFHLESSSGKNRKAYVPNAVGALGGYQITQPAFKDIQKAHPDFWGKLNFKDVALDDTLARKAASDILSINSQYLSKMGVAPSEDSLLGAYHSGAGNVASNTMGPFGRRYVETGMNLLMEKRNAK